MAAIGSHFNWGEFHVNIFRDSDNKEYLRFETNSVCFDLNNEQSRQFKFFIENYFQEKSQYL